MKYHMEQKISGFTLIELLVVISIIGLLSSITLFSIIKVQIKARDVQSTQTMQEISNALKLYYSDNGHYPIGDKSTLTNTNGSNVYFYSHTTWNKLANKLHNYIPKVAIDPNGGWSLPPFDYVYLTNGTGYAYWTNADGSKYQLMGRLEGDNPVECKHTDYKAIVPYIFAAVGDSICKGGYADYYTVFNTRLYVISSE